MGRHLIIFFIFIIPFDLKFWQHLVRYVLKMCYWHFYNQLVSIYLIYIYKKLLKRNNLNGHMFICHLIPLLLSCLIKVVAFTLLSIWMCNNWLGAKININCMIYFVVHNSQLLSKIVQGIQLKIITNNNLFLLILNYFTVSC